MMVRITKPQKSPTTRVIQPLMWMLLAFYVGYHALHGERGLYALMREKRELAELQTEYQKTKADRERAEIRVSHLRDGSLDRDLLDEQMRRMMGVMKPGEVMLLNDEPAAKN